MNQHSQESCWAWAGREQLSFRHQASRGSILRARGLVIMTAIDRIITAELKGELLAMKPMEDLEESLVYSQARIKDKY